MPDDLSTTVCSARDAFNGRADDTALGEKVRLANAKVLQ
jgi:hypothetical protein